MTGFDRLECVQIERAVEAAEYRTKKYLTAKGWEHTSQTVGFRWMWFKTINGRQYGCDTDDAFRIQSHIDRNEYADANPQEFPD